MKSISKTMVLLLALTLLTPAMVSAKGNQGAKGNTGPAVVVELSPEDESTLLWMREEEKLARDVYLAMDKTWKQQVFRNIANSEQNHIDALLRKMNTFGIDDLVPLQRGVFYSSELQELYDILVAKGNESYVGALKVGATIEDLDIYDLKVAIEATNNVALKTTYESLLEGSKNHLRSFIGLLQQQGEDYKPQYIDEVLFDAIINE